MTVWRSFWEGPSPFPTATWDWQARLFLRSSANLFPVGPSDSLLDIGCGPGSLAVALRDHAAPPRQYFGLDVSAAFISEARDRLHGANAYRFATLGPDYLDLSQAAPGPFTRLLALSVVQYYREASELRRLLDALRSLAAPGAFILIADLPVHESGGALGEIGRTLKRATLQGSLGRQTLFLMRCACSGYRETRKQAGLLLWDRGELEALAADVARRWNAEVQLLDDPLTVSVGRVHLRIRLPGP